MKGFVQTAFHYAAYLAYRAFCGAAASLPLPACARLGAAMGLLGWACAPAYRRLVLRNLRLAFAGERGEAELHALARASFQSLGRNILLSVKIASLAPDQIEARVRFEGLENMESALAAGRGFIGAVAHLGPWEIFSQLPSLGSGVARSTMFRALGNRFINRHVVAQRSRLGVKLFDRSTGFQGPVDHLRGGGGVGILIDQHAGEGGLWCPFFGRLASTTNLPALLSLRTGAPVITVSILPDGPLRWRVAYRPAHFPPETGPRPADAAAALTAALNRELEDAIREAPEEWFWLHDRWKTPSPRFLIGGSRRGIVLPRPGDPPLKPFRLLVRSPNPLGDACMALPALRAIKAGRPDLHLTVLCRENLAPFWTRRPEADSVLAFPRDASPFQTGKLIRAAAPFDASLLLPNSLRAALEAWSAGIPRIAGWTGHRRRWLLHQIIRPPRPGPPRHHAHSYLHLAQAIGADILEQAAAVDAPAASPPRARLAAARPRLGICPGAEYGPAKRWPAERFARAANLAREEIDCQITLFGSPAERAAGESLAALIEGPCDNRAGQTDLAQLMDELQDCDALLTNDTGTMHLAALLGVPVVAVFGSTEPLWTRPLGPGHRVLRRHVECSPCFLRECPPAFGFRCMNELDPETAATAVVEILRQATAAPAAASS